ncbi:hypothetical protein SDC9_111296 [bioreactor metagenome]|uniref:Uncharacterized protein n=1 Tax=bioreactor metagenome TaxID=1076179 RepID=A0A645BG47_9ZZZZ
MRRLFAKANGLGVAKAHGTVECVDAGVVNVGFDDDALCVQAIEHEAHDQGEHLAAETVEALGGWADEQVHAKVAGLCRVVLSHLVTRWVVALHQKGGALPVQPHPGIGVGAVAQLLVGPTDIAQAEVLHGPETCVVHVEPLLQQRRVARWIELAQRQSVIAVARRWVAREGLDVDGKRGSCGGFHGGVPVVCRRLPGALAWCCERLSTRIAMPDQRAKSAGRGHHPPSTGAVPCA